MNELNIIFLGKTLQNPFQKDIKLVNKWRHKGKRHGGEILVSKPNFKSLTVFNENFVAIELKPMKTVLKMPFVIGQVVLDESKLSLYKCIYEWAIPFFGRP